MQTDQQPERVSTSVNAAQLAEALLAHPGRVVITAHVRPDGDAIGAALGLCLALQAAGRQAVCAGLEPIDDAFDFLEGREAILPADGYVPEPGDVMAIVDCGDFSRIPAALQAAARERAGFCIDHHKSNAGFATFCMIDPTASSSAELVQSVIEAGNLPMNRGIAEALWAGIVTDTGRFSYPGTTPETFRRAAVLLEHGVRFAMINEGLFNTVSLCRLRLKRRLLDSLQVSTNGCVAMGSLGPDDYADARCEMADSENFVDVVRSIKGVRIAAFVRQQAADGRVHISLRSSEPFDASQICAEWGGGGHARAAGATLSGTIEASRAAVFSRLEAIEGDAAVDPREVRTT